MLAYVFLHRPREGVAPSTYLARLQDFHEALAATPPAGFVQSWVWRVAGGPLGSALEDWYLVQDWTALGMLNAGAVNGPRQHSHDVVAPLSGEGTGAVYKLLRGAPSPTSPSSRMRVAKPGGSSYAQYEDDLSRSFAGSTIWKRQMVLGRDAEFLIESPDAMSGQGDPHGGTALKLAWGR